MKQRKCLKLTAYIYLPDENADKNELRYYSASTPGRIAIFDDFGKRPSKMVAFDNLGHLIQLVEKERHKRILKRVKRSQ